MNIDPKTIEPTLRNLDSFSMDDQGQLSYRKKRGGGNKRLGVMIEEMFFEIVQRPMKLADISPEVAVMIIMRLKRQNARGHTLGLWFEWFKDRNLVAFTLGWAEQHDFSQVRAGTKTDWTQNRQNLAMPEAVAVKKCDRSTEQSLTLTAFLDGEYIPARLVGKSPNTIRLYRNTIRSFTKWLGRAPVVGDLNTKTVAGYLQWMLEHTQLSPHTIEKERTELTAFWNFAARRGWLPDFPDIPAINCPKRVPDAWSDEQLVALMKACESDRGDIGKVPASKFWPALVSIIYDTGERIGAVLELTFDDIDKSGWLIVRGEHRKGGKADKGFKLRPETVKRIEAIRQYQPTGRIFEWPYAKTFIWKKFGECIEDAGLPSNRRTKFHKIRRSAASDFEAAGGNATALLGHSDRRTTEAYLDPRVIKEIHPADIVPGIGQKGADRDVSGHQSDAPKTTEGTPRASGQNGQKSDAAEKNATDSMVDQFRAFLEQQGKGGAS
ncbi:tyrosine-type recombinase/integrase [Rhodopirellula bahusiensis]|nr:site-specific integrase [Rhodopirellula bahusiensis]